MPEKNQEQLKADRNQQQKNHNPNQQHPFPFARQF